MELYPGGWFRSKAGQGSCPGTYLLDQTWPGVFECWVRLSLNCPVLLSDYPTLTGSLIPPCLVPSCPPCPHMNPALAAPHYQGVSPKDRKRRYSLSLESLTTYSPSSKRPTPRPRPPLRSVPLLLCLGPTHPVAPLPAPAQPRHCTPVPPSPRCFSQSLCPFPFQAVQRFCPVAVWTVSSRALLPDGLAPRGRLPVRPPTRALHLEQPPGRAKHFGPFLASIASRCDVRPRPACRGPSTRPCGPVHKGRWLLRPLLLKFLVTPLYRVTPSIT